VTLSVKMLGKVGTDEARPTGHENPHADTSATRSGKLRASGAAVNRRWSGRSGLCRK
jgi:hypothetical protein